MMKPTIDISESRCRICGTPWALHDLICHSWTEIDRAGRGRTFLPRSPAAPTTDTDDTIDAQEDDESR